MTTDSRHTSARLLYRPFGLASSIVGGAVAGQVFKRFTPGPEDHAPGPLESRYSARQVIVSAALQGAVFAAVKAAIDRGGARVFQRWTGEWPGR